MDSGKKIGFFTCVCLAIGSIIGAGIFGTLPRAVELSGKGIVIAFVIASIATFIRYWPAIVTGSALPASYSFYLHCTRLIGPRIGFSYCIESFFLVTIQALVVAIFAEYYIELFPGDTRVAALCTLVVFGVATCFGARVNGALQNVMVLILLSALFSFVILGIPSISPENLTVWECIRPQGQTIMSIGAAAGILSTALQGGYTIMNYAEEIKSPEKLVPLTFVISTTIAAILYILMCIVLIGVVGVGHVTTLSECAAEYMSPAFQMFFYFGGPIFALLSSVNVIFLAASRKFEVMARDGLLPDFIAKKNRFNAPQNSIMLFMAAAVIIVVFDVGINTLVDVSSLFPILFGMLLFIPAVRVSVRYPNTYKASFAKMRRGPLLTIIALGVAASLWMVYSLVSVMSPTAVLVMAAAIVICYVYFYLRYLYLKGKGRDLLQSMSKPFPAWEQREKELSS